MQDLRQTVVLVEEYEDGLKVGVQGGRGTPAGAELKDRRVGRVVTPGTLIDESWLSGEESRYLLAIAGPVDGSEGTVVSLAYTDASTGEFFAKDSTLDQMEDELARIAPREVVLNSSLKTRWYKATPSSATTPDLLSLLRVLNIHVSFADVHPPSGYSDEPPRIRESFSLEATAITLLRHHLQYALRDSMPSLDQPLRQSSSEHMLIDAATLQALEIRHSIRTNTLESQQYIGPTSQRGTLLSVLSRTVNPSGHRLLIRTLTSPSTNIPKINQRLALVQAFVDRPELRTDLREMLKGLVDVMRLMQRFRSRAGDGRDVWEVSRWIRGVAKMLARIKQEIGIEQLRSSPATASGVARLDGFVAGFQGVVELAKKIENAVDEGAVMRGVEVVDEEEAEGVEAAGEALVAETGKREYVTGREAREKEKEERDRNMWWIRSKSLDFFTLYRLRSLSASLRHCRTVMTSLQSFEAPRTTCKINYGRNSVFHHSPATEH